MVKSYGQKRFVTKMKYISLLFLPRLDLLLSLLEGPLNLFGVHFVKIEWDESITLNPRMFFFKYDPS